MGSEFGAIWEDSEGGFIKFAVKRAFKHDQTLRLHMEGKLHVILDFREEWVSVVEKALGTLVIGMHDQTKLIW